MIHISLAKLIDMDGFNQLLCGLNTDRLRNLGFFPKLPRRPSLPNFGNFNLPNLPNLNLPNLNLSNLPIIGNGGRDSNKPCRKHIPVGSGRYTVGCVDLMSNHTVNGTFIRLYYPTQSTDIFVSMNFKHDI